MSAPNNLRSLYSKLNVLYRTLGRLNAGKQGGWSNKASLPDMLEYLRMIYAVGSAVLDTEENLPRSLQGHIESSVERILIEIEDYLDGNGTSNIRKLRSFITNDVHPTMDECESGLAWILSDIERGENAEGRMMDIETLSSHLSLAGVKHVVVAATPEIEAMERFEANPSVSALHDIILAQKIDAARLHKLKDGVRVVGNFIEVTVKLSDSQSVRINVKTRSGKKIAETTHRYLHGFGYFFTNIDAAWQWLVY